MTLSLADPGGATLGGTTTVGAGQGVASFTGLTDALGMPLEPGASFIIARNGKGLSS